MSASAPTDEAAPGETRAKCARCGKQSTTPGDWAECFTVCDECWPAQLGPQDAKRFAPTDEAARLADELMVRREAAHMDPSDRAWVEGHLLDAAARLLRGEYTNKGGRDE